MSGVSPDRLIILVTLNPENKKMNTKKIITAFAHLGSVINDYLVFDDELLKAVTQIPGSSVTIFAFL